METLLRLRVIRVKERLAVTSVFVSPCCSRQLILDDEKSVTVNIEKVDYLGEPEKASNTIELQMKWSSRPWSKVKKRQELSVQERRKRVLMTILSNIHSFHFQLCTTYISILSTDLRRLLSQESFF